jgi:hypothetical protein
MALIVRLFVVFVAYVLACIAAAIVFTIGALTPQWDQIAPNGMPSLVLWSAVVVSTAVIGIVAILPWFLIVALAEGFAWRSIVFYGVLGAVLALALAYGVDFSAALAGPDRVIENGREVIAASGIAGGLVYWAFAGRKAGLWKS